MTDDEMKKASAAQDLLLDFIAKTPALADMSAINLIQGLLNTGLTVAIRCGARSRLPAAGRRGVRGLCGASRNAA